MHETSPAGSPAYPALGLPASVPCERHVSHEARLWGGSPGRHVTLYHGEWAPIAPWNVWIDTGYLPASGHLLDDDLDNGATWLAAELYLNVVPAPAHVPSDEVQEWRWRMAHGVAMRDWEDVRLRVDGAPTPFRVMRGADGAWVATCQQLPRVVHMLGWGVEPDSLQLESVTRLSRYEPLTAPQLPVL